MIEITVPFVVLIPLWFACGWLPTRIVKHQFISEFGECCYTRGDEFEDVLIGVVGPMGLTGCMLFMLALGKKAHWGWTW